MDVEFGSGDNDMPTVTQLPAANCSADPSVNVFVHPLVILNISEHWTRVCAQHTLTPDSPRPRVYGILMGQHTGRDVEILNSFELLVHTPSAVVDVHSPPPAEGDTSTTGATTQPTISVDATFCKTREQQYCEVFPHLDVLGWYTTSASAAGPLLDDCDLQLHQQLFRLYDSPPLHLIVRLCVHEALRSRSQPLLVLESALQHSSRSHTRVRQLPYHVRTDQAERVAVDHIAHATMCRQTQRSALEGADGGVGRCGAADSSQLTQGVRPLYGALGVLLQRVQLLHAYLQSARDGQVPLDMDILRGVAHVTRWLPALARDGRSAPALRAQMSDAMLVVYLATLTKMCNAMLGFVNKANVVAHDRHVDRHGTRKPRCTASLVDIK